MVILLVGCGVNTSQTTTPETSTQPTSTVTKPFVISVSFPNGAPPLNQTATLKCVIKSNFPPLDANLNIELPEAFILVGGELSWSGSVDPYCEVNAIEASVKSVKTGNWTIRVLTKVGNTGG
jgi:hypothetical protein